MMGTVDFAGTDGPLNKTQMLDFSTHRNCEVLHFPTALERMFRSTICRESGLLQFHSASARRHISRDDHQMERPGDCETQSERIALPAKPILWLSIGKTEAAPPTFGPTI